MVDASQRCLLIACCDVDAEVEQLQRFLLLVERD
jgi:hypothetical protein